jgi:hypothetical protein
MAKRDGHATLLKAYLDEVCNRLDQCRRAPAFRKWRTAWLGVPVAAGLSLAATQCSGTSKGPTEECKEDTCLQLCDDGVDNDADGAVDCDDPDCSEVCVGGGGAGGATGGLTETGGIGGLTGTGGIGVGPVYSAPLVESCDNGADEDGDGLIDCDDPDCDDDVNCIGPVPLYASPLYAAPIPSS